MSAPRDRKSKHTGLDAMPGAGEQRTESYPGYGKGATQPATPQRAKNSVFALVDCNNFFVSCERVFRPDLEGKPVVVLSSNDGCAVARSNEAKALGIPMAAPAFKYKQLFKAQNVKNFSANFELYGDFSKRIIQILSEVTPRIEVYSVDESFLEISSLHIKDYEKWAKTLRARILKEVGVPVSIGIAHTKLLSKLAAEQAKHIEDLSGALSLIDLSQADMDKYLVTTPINNVWGVGRKLAPALRAEGISNAQALRLLRPRRAQQLMGIHGRQMVSELNQVNCYSLEPLYKLQQSVMRGRTFGEDTNEMHVIEAAIASLTAQAAFRLRREGLLAHRASILLNTNRHKPGYKRWVKTVVFDTPTNDSGLIISALINLASEIYSPQQEYHRANILLHDFAQAAEMQTDLLGLVDTDLHARATNRMRAVDQLNRRFGKGRIYYAAEDLSKSWQPKHNIRSPHYTTNWNELPTAEIY